MFAIFTRKLFGNRQSRHARPKRRLKRELNVELLSRRELLAADLAYDSSQVVVVEDIAQNQATGDDYVVQIAGTDTLELSAGNDTAEQPTLASDSSTVNPLACVHVHAAVTSSSAGDRWAYGGRRLDSLATFEADYFLHRPREGTAEPGGSTFTRLENVMSDDRDDGDIDDVMVGDIGGAYVHDGSLHDRLSQDADIYSLQSGRYDNLRSEGAGLEVSDEIDDPDLIDGEGAADANVAGPEDDLDLVAMAGSGGGYGGYGGETPEILDFVGVPSLGDNWTFTGDVTDNVDPTDLTVTLEGPGIIEITTITVAENDTFTVAVEVAPGSFGYVGASVVDEDGNTSQVAWFFVDND